MPFCSKQLSTLLCPTSLIPSFPSTTLPTTGAIVTARASCLRPHPLIGPVTEYIIAKLRVFLGPSDTLPTPRPLLPLPNEPSASQSFRERIPFNVDTLVHHHLVLSSRYMLLHLTSRIIKSWLHPDRFILSYMEATKLSCPHIHLTILVIPSRTSGTRKARHRPRYSSYRGW